MLGVKVGTTTWGKPEDTTALQRDTSKSIAATEKEAALGGEEAIGDVLNKVADPNYVDPSKAQRKVGNNSLDKDAFLKLMLAQMKHQDPTNPQPSHEMAAQLAQFTSLEQLNNINSTLGNMSKAQTPQLNYQALNFIGKKVSGDSSKLLRIANDTKHDFNFNLAADASKVTVKVLDSDGNAVRTIENKNFKKGANTITWNGMSDDGAAARPGEYKFQVEASNSNGQKVFAKTDFDGKITGMNFTPEGPVLLVGNQTIRMQDVKRIEEIQDGAMPSVPVQAGQILPQGAQQAPQKKSAPSIQQQQQQQQEEKVGKAVDPLVKADIKKSVAMSGPMLDQVKKAMGNNL